MIGQTISHYRILEKLGRGGMGEVYRAEDTRLGRQVALKFLPEDFRRDAERRARFEREAHLLATLNHPGIAAIYGLEEANEAPFLVLELVEGETLAERLNRGPLPVDEALAICQQVTEALEAAHGKSVIHRDLKPANIKITPEGKVKVLDFGLAKAVGEKLTSRDISASPTLTSPPTQVGLLLGTAAYMSPEQARGRPVDHRGDIWAFGCVLYELLAGKRAFPGETVSDTIASILRVEPGWHFLPSNAPSNIRLLLRRCLEKDLTRRLQHIGDVRIEIEDALAGAEAVSTPLPAAGSAPRFGASRAVSWIGAGLVVGALAASLTLRQMGRLGSTRQAMRFSAVTNFAGVEAQPSFSPDGRSVTFVSNRDGQYDIYVGLIGGGSLVRITNDRNLKARPRWSPDGSKIAYAQLNRDGLWDIWVVPALGGSTRRIVLNANDPAWSSDGRSLAYSSARTIWISDATGGNARAVTKAEPSVSHVQPAFSPDDGSLAYVRRRNGPRGELAVVDISTGRVNTLTDDGALVLSPAWSAQGKTIYFASSRNGTVNVWKTPSQGGEPEQITAGQGDDAELDVSRDGKRIVFSTYHVNLNIAELDIESKRQKEPPKWLTTDPARGEFAPAYSPDGKRIAYFTNRKGAERESIWLIAADGSNPTQLVEDDRINVFPRWAADGKILIYNSSSEKLAGYQRSGLEIRYVNTQGGSPQKFPVSTPATPVDIGRDGRLLFFAPEGGIDIYDPKSNITQKAPGAEKDFRGGLLRWSPDQKSIAYFIPASATGDTDAGLWVDDLQGTPRQVFRGWVVWYAWGRQGDLVLVEGKPNLNGELWRVGVDGKRPVRTPADVPLRDDYTSLLPEISFDVSPDGHHIALTRLEVLEADIGMIENIP